MSFENDEQLKLLDNLFNDVERMPPKVIVCGGGRPSAALMALLVAESMRKVDILVATPEDDGVYHVREGTLDDLPDMQPMPPAPLPDVKKARARVHAGNDFHAKRERTHPTSPHAGQKMLGRGRHFNGKR